MTIRRFFMILLVPGVFGACLLLYLLNRPYQGFSGETFVDIPKGTGAGNMADALEKAGVIQSRWEFLLVRTIKRRTLQAGEYRFAKPASVLEVYDRIARGDIFYYELVVPEGKNMFDIAALVEQLGVFSGEQFLAAARNPSLIRDLDPKALTLEGFLFPNTYRLTRATTPERLCRSMAGKFREIWQTLGAHADVHEKVTLASMVEKEGKLAEERPLIASVFENRLRIGMKLDCDPTTIYAALLEKRYRGTIHRSDLASESQYNTYRHAGLPPGPIANPGLASLKAVLNPASTDALYFVARPDGSGGHRFSKTLLEQQAAIADYRRGLAK